MDCAFHRPKSRPLNCSCLCVGQSTKANRGNPRRPIRPTIQHAWRQATARPLHGLVCGAVWPSVSAVFESDSDQNAVSCWGQKRRESRLGIAFTGSGGHFGAKGIVQKRMKVLSPFNFAFVEMPSRLIDRAVDQIAGLPGVGRRTALRLALHLLGRNEEDVRRFTEAIQDMKEGVLSCKTCGNLGEEDVCSICLDGRRDPARIAVVEDLRDLLAIESTGHFKGRYHVLGGVISPMDGVGPADLRIESLLKRVGEPAVVEVIFALPTTMEGDTTSFYINKRLQDTEVEVTTLARGVAVGDELQYADELTLIRSLQQRLPYSTASDANSSAL